MKLLFVCPDWFPYSAGLSQSCLEICQFLEEQGHEIRIVVAKDKVLDDKGMKLVRVPFLFRLLGRNPIPLQYWKHIKKDVEWADKICLFSYMYEMNSRIVLFKKLGLFNKEIIHFYRGSLEKEGVQFLSWPVRFAKHLWDQTLGKIMFTQTNMTISNSKPTLDYIHNMYGVSYPKLHYAPTPIHINSFKSTNLKNKRVLFVGRLVENKGIHHIQKIIKEIPKDWTFTIVGNGPLEHLITDAQKKHKNIEHHHRLPHEELKVLFSQSDILVLPTYAEGSPRAVIEASCSKVPSVVFDAGDVSTILPQDLISSIGNIDSLCKSLRKLIQDPSYLLQKSKEVYQGIQQHHHLDALKLVTKLIEKPKKPRILFVTGIYPPDIGGPATYVKLLHQELGAKGYPHHILTLGEEASSKDISYISRTASYLKRNRLIKKFIEENDFDIIYAQSPFSVGLGFARAKTTATKIMKVVGDNVWEIAQDKYKVRMDIDTFQNKSVNPLISILKKIQNYAVAKSDLIITPSVYLKRIVKGWGVPAKKIKVIYNAIQKPNPKKVTPEYDSYYVSVARLTPWKGFDVLVDVFSELEENLVIIGSGDEYEHLKNITAKKKNILLKGKLSRAETLGYIKASKGLILNSGYEGLPHVVIEALELQTPVFVSKKGGNTELVGPTDGKTFAYNNKEHILKVLKEPVISSKKKHRKEFTLAYMLADLEEVLNEHHKYKSR